MELPRRKIGLCEGYAHDVYEYGFGACQKGPCPFRPAALLEVPFHRLDAVAVADAGVGKQARKRFELRITLGQQRVRGFEDFALVKQMGWNRGRKRDQRGRVVVHVSSPCLSYPSIRTAQ